MNKAFTLIEILVVISVVSILAAILFPVLSAAKRHSGEVGCSVHLRQLGLASELYAQDFDDRLPYGPGPIAKDQAVHGTEYDGDPFTKEKASLPDVRTVLKGYGAAQPLWACPNDQISPLLREERSESTWSAETGSSYEYDSNDALSSMSFTEVADPSSKLLFGDTEAFHGGGNLTSDAKGLHGALLFDGHSKVVTHEVFASFKLPNYLCYL